MNNSTVFIFTIKTLWLDYRYSKYPGRYNFLFFELGILLFPSFIVEDFPHAGKALTNNFPLNQIKISTDRYLRVGF